MPKIFLPSLHNDEPELEPVILPCGMNPVAWEWTQHWLARLGSRAKKMKCNERLVDAAQSHAEWLSKNYSKERSMHIGKDGSKANQRARRAGYRLSSQYGDSNTIESASKTSKGPAKSVENLFNSPAHKKHLTGDGWYENSTVYGIGAAGNIYIALVSPPEDD